MDPMPALTISAKYEDSKRIKAIMADKKSPRGLPMIKGTRK
jgi:hypothetical protein